MTIDKIAKLLQAIENKDKKFHDLSAAASTLTGALWNADQRIKDMSFNLLSEMMEYAMVDGELADAVQDLLSEKSEEDNEQRA